MLALDGVIAHGFINLHTGLSPYARGGNCNLFMLLEGKPQYVGATIHYIDSGIDSGDIIRTIRPEMHAGEPFEFIDAKVFIEGVEAMVSSLEHLFQDSAPRVRQWTEGQLFLRKTGYNYSPHVRLQVNRKLGQGMLKEYLDNRETMDSDVRLVQ